MHGVRYTHATSLVFYHNLHVCLGRTCRYCITSVTIQQNAFYLGGAGAWYPCSATNQFQVLR